MPAKNAIKIYLSNGFYHIYNRGVEKRTIFTDKQDESVFLKHLNQYLSPKNIPGLSQIIADPLSSPKDKSDALKHLRLNNFAEEIDLLAYCLMPNHFHLLVKQKTERAIEAFMRSLSTRYVQYFNLRHDKRVGGLFQDTYKAVLVETEEQLLHLSRYIHLNPKGTNQPSSYPNYLGSINQDWVKPQEILAYFAKSGFNSYTSFVESSKYDGPSLTLITHLLHD